MEIHNELLECSSKIIDYLSIKDAADLVNKVSQYVSYS